MNIIPMKTLMVHEDIEERGQLSSMLARFKHGGVFAGEMALSDDF